MFIVETPKDKPDILVRKLSCSHKCFICVTKFVMNLITLTEPFQNLYSFIYGWLRHFDRLKPSLKSWIFLNMLSVFIKGGGTNALQATKKKQVMIP